MLSPFLAVVDSDANTTAVWYVFNVLLQLLSPLPVLLMLT